MRGMTLRAIAEACNGVYYGSEDNLDKEVTTALMMERCVLYQKKNLKDRLILI